MKHITSWTTIKIMCMAVSVLMHIAWLDPFRDLVQLGNGKYNDKKYEEAAKHYKDAEEFAPGQKAKQKLSFNKGAANYMQGNVEEAVKQYEKALQSGDKEIQKKSLFNMGNAYMKKKKYRKAVKSYIDALKIDPDYEKAKKNIEYILKQQKNEQKNNNDQNKNDKDRQNQEDDKQKQGKDKEAGKNKNEQNKNKAKDGKKLSPEQVEKLLESMKEKPVRRQKGDGRGMRYLEKPW